jgi:hypothetical protein
MTSNDEYNRTRTANEQYDLNCLHNIRRTLESALKRAQREQDSRYCDVMTHCLDELNLAGIIAPVPHHGVPDYVG